MENVGGVMKENGPLELYDWNTQGTGPHLKVRLSNICNFKCRGCNHEYSNRFLGYRKRLLLGQSDIDFDSLQTLHVSGGEPFKDYRTEWLLSEVRPHTKVTIHTNGSIYPDYKLNPQWQIAISLNGIGPVAEFVAHSGLKWDEYKETLTIWRRNHPVYWKTNISLLNCMDYENIVRFAYPVVTMQEGFLDIAHAHPEVKKRIPQFQRYLNSKQYRPDYRNEFLKNMERVNKVPESLQQLTEWVKAYE